MSSEQTLNLEQEIRAIMAEILQREPHTIDSEAHFDRDLGMDSIMTLETLAGIEKKCRIAIPEETLPQFTDLSTTLALVKSLLAAKS